MPTDTPDQAPTTGTAPVLSPGAAAHSGEQILLGSRADDGAFETDVVLVDPRPSLLTRVGAEAVGTFFLVLAGLGVALYAALSSAGSLGIALAFGLALIGGLIAFGHVSGGHFNPAVTLGAAIAGRSPWGDVLPYWVAQIVGGALAAGALFVTIPAALPALVAQGDTSATTRTFFGQIANGYGASSPLATLSTDQVRFDLLPALLIEILATALLVGVFLAATSGRTRTPVAAAPFAIGLTYAVLLLVASPITNGGLNPARSTAAAIFSDGAFGQLWLFWVAPIVGAALAGLAYRAFASPDAEYLLSEEDPNEDLIVSELR